MTRTFAFFLLFITVCTVRAQEYRELNFRSPLNIPLVLAANFGEIRPDHFHMGVDFKTNGKEGFSIYAIERGYVSRIKISPDGYGKSIYINHPNGITSVYAHCSSFKGSIDSLVKEVQKKVENFEVDIYLKPTELPVSKGKLIAISGNTGHSLAPHLHFELRDSETEVALNPLVYGFKVSDHIKPEIHRMRVYGVNEKGYLIPGKQKTFQVVYSSGKYSIAGNEVVLPAHFYTKNGGLGFAFQTKDKFDAAPNVCGIYSSTLTCNSETIFEQRINKISFENTRYVNDHVDIQAYRSDGIEFQKSFKTAHNPLEIYHKGNGILKIEPGIQCKMNFITSDVSGNKSELNFNVKIEKGQETDERIIFSPDSYFLPDSSYQLKNEKFQYYISRNTFYQPALRIKNSSIESIADMNIAIQLPIVVKTTLPLGPNKNQFYIEETTRKGRKFSILHDISGNEILGETKEIGKFNLKQDTIAPFVSAYNFSGSNCKQKSKLIWKFSEVSTELKDYDLFLDGTWQILELERKGNFLIFEKPTSLKGKHTLKLIVTDTCGNKRSVTTEVIF